MSYVVESTDRALKGFGVDLLSLEDGSNVASPVDDFEAGEVYSEFACVDCPT